MTTPAAAARTLTEHPHYRYRGCQPDPDQPTRAAGDPDLTVNAWLPHTGDGQENQAERHARERAAITVCGYCPVRAACRAYANTLTDEGLLAEPEGIWGGELALERHRALIAARTAAAPAPQPAPVTAERLAEARTPAKRTVLRALARHTDPELVAIAARMDLRTANWHRSALVSLLGLDKETTTREQLLAAAVAHGLLPDTVRIVPDGRWPLVAAPTTDGARQRRLAPDMPIQLTIPGLPHYPRRPPAPAPRRPAVVRRLRVVPAPTVPLALPHRALEPAA
ncbi:WhiB family transcriptional regulator [Streptomyces sp. DH12]|uniref:WhiB family transcriptional regulator n=1 Tax=Streptomyces sp. DH12 TaxID=2857010 RepID=UPI001E5A2E51|nr:WhiB family transcriptional regulator [Streptomyces sp. DH12]